MAPLGQLLPAPQAPSCVVVPVSAPASGVGDFGVGSVVLLLQWTTPRIASRVVCGIGDTMESSCSSAALRIVDLPTFGRPMIATVPAREGPSGTARLARRFGSCRDTATRGALADVVGELNGDGRSLRCGAVRVDSQG